MSHPAPLTETQRAQIGRRHPFPPPGSAPPPVPTPTFPAHPFPPPPSIPPSSPPAPEFPPPTNPDPRVGGGGPRREADGLTKQLVAAGKLVRLNPQWRPNSYLARTDPRDVARVEESTFICSPSEEDAGPTNNWRDPRDMRTELRGVFDGSMKGRTMYVVPFSMGPLGGGISQLGVQLTDSPYAVLSMGIMTRTGEGVYRLIEAGEPWMRTVHSVGYPLVDGLGRSRDDVVWPCNDTK